MTEPQAAALVATVDEAFMHDAPEGTVLYKPEFAGWALFIRDGGWWRVVDAYDRDYRGRRYTPAAVGCHSPGHVIFAPPSIGYYPQSKASSVAPALEGSSTSETALTGPSTAPNAGYRKGGGGHGE